LSLANKEKFAKRDDYGNFDSNLFFLEQTGLLANDKKILEIGCGTCRLLNYFLQKSYDIRGVDVNREYLAQGRKLYGSLPVEQVESERLPFADNSFDLVFGFDVFEHIDDTAGHLKEVSRVLKDNGHYLLQTPNKWTNVIFESIRWKSFTSWRNDHCALHSFFEVQKRFAEHGFEVEFYDIPIVTDFFRDKVRSYMGSAGLLFLKIFNIDKFPYCLRTNFYLSAAKK